MRRRWFATEPTAWKRGGQEIAVKMISRLSWGLWIPGTILLLLGWFNLIPPHIGEIGKWVAIVGVVLAWIPKFASMADVEPDPKPPEAAPGAESELPKK